MSSLTSSRMLALRCSVAFFVVVASRSQMVPATLLSLMASQ